MSLGNPGDIGVLLVQKVLAGDLIALTVASWEEQDLKGRVLNPNCLMRPGLCNMGRNPSRIIKLNSLNLLYVGNLYYLQSLPYVRPLYRRCFDAGLSQQAEPTDKYYRGYTVCSDLKLYLDSPVSKTLDHSNF